MRPRVVRDKRSNLDKLRKQLEGLDRKFVVAGIVGMPQSTGLLASQHVIGYASVQEFGATIKPGTYSVTTYKRIKKNAETMSAFDKNGKKRKTHLNKGRFVTAKKAQTGKGTYMSETFTGDHNGYNIPSRPFLRSWYDTNLTALIKFAETEIVRTLMKGQPAEVTLNRIGVFAQAGIRKRIRTARSWARPLAPSTIKKKGSSAPLIDSGIMINSVSFDIRTR